MISAHRGFLSGADCPFIGSPAKEFGQARARFSIRRASRQRHAAALTALVLAAQALSAAEFRPVKGEPGLSYKNEKIASEPWSIHVLRMDRNQKDLAVYSAHASDRNRDLKVLGVSFIADQARQVPTNIGRAIAAVNGDFYVRDNPTYAGDPRGLQIVNGEIISAPDTVCVWFDPEGNPHLDEVKGNFTVTWPDGRSLPVGLNQQRTARTAVLYTPTYGVTTRAPAGREIILERDGEGPWLPLQASETYRARIREVRTNGNSRLVADAVVLSIGPALLTNLPDLTNGMQVQISTATTPSLKGVKAAIGGGPAIVRDGKAIVPPRAPPGTSGDYSLRSRYERHPRSAIGWSATNVFLIIVDGRQPRLSDGMKLSELGEFMVGLGCTEAMNLDGGKSAQMWMNGDIINSPCQGEDTVANSLVLIRRAAK